MTRGGRRLLALTVGVALPTLLLGIGWLTASLREQEALEREQEQLLARTADTIRGAVDESLEELRRREDVRPFYLYNRLYSPPDVIALNDPLATSPLAGDPDDRRIVGYFQILPGGVVRTPHGSGDSGGPRSPRAERVATLVRGGAFAPLHPFGAAADPLSNDEQSPLLAALTPRPQSPPAAEPASAAAFEPGPEPRRRRTYPPRPRAERPAQTPPAAAAPRGDAAASEPDGGSRPAAVTTQAVASVGTGARPPAAAPQAASRVQPSSTGARAARPRSSSSSASTSPFSTSGSSTSGGSSSGWGRAGRYSPQQSHISSSAQVPTLSQAELAPQGSLVTNLGEWNRDVYRDIQEAQSGSAAGNYRMQTRGRAAPIIRRNTVGWQEMADNNAEISQVRANAAKAQAQRARAQAAQAQARIAAVQAKQRAAATQAATAAGAAEPTAEAPTAAVSRPSPRPRPRRARPRRARPEPPSPEPTINPLAQEEVEVDYTPMAWRVLDDQSIVLHRAVSHEGTAVVQGVVIDRRHIVDEWIPALLARHSVTPVPATVVDGDGNARCAMRRQASDLLEGIELCYSPAAVRAAGASIENRVTYQIAALAGLVFIVGLAGFAMFRATRRAEELSAQKSSFVSSVSHELRTPLTTIRMHAEMLRDGLVPEAKRDRFHRQLVHESVRLSQLVENVLELSRLEEGRRVLQPQLGDLRAAVAGVVAEQRPFVEERGFELRSVADADAEPVTLRFDAQAVSQVAINLIDNAVKYGAGESESAVEVSVEAEGDGALLVVRDHGPGIPEGQQERVFERFHRISDPEKKHMPGTGIGLSLVRELARAHGGDAEVRHPPGGGCEVRVFFPGGGESAES